MAPRCTPECLWPLEVPGCPCEHLPGPRPPAHGQHEVRGYQELGSRGYGESSKHNRGRLHWGVITRMLTRYRIPVRVASGGDPGAEKVVSLLFLGSLVSSSALSCPLDLCSCKSCLHCFRTFLALSSLFPLLSYVYTDRYVGLPTPLCLLLCILCILV